MKDQIKQFFQSRRLKMSGINSVAIRKEDDEITRFYKTTNNRKNRKSFEDNLRRERVIKELSLNTQEIRLKHHEKMLGLEDDVYNTTYRNDTIAQYKFLHDKANYRPLQQKFRAFPWFVYPIYARREDYERYTGPRRYFIRSIAFLILLKVGYELGKADAIDVPFESSTVVEFENEDQIYDFLLNAKKTAVFLSFYYPGHTIDEAWNKQFEDASHKYSHAAGVKWKAEEKARQRNKSIAEKVGLRERKSEAGRFAKTPEDDIVFMRVFCRKNLNFCFNKQWSGRILPSAEVYYLNEEDRIELLDFDNYHRSVTGIEGFFAKNGLIDEEFQRNPDALVERAGKKMLQII